MMRRRKKMFVSSKTHYFAMFTYRTFTWQLDFSQGRVNGARALVW
jgi:hypothetical protein